MKIVLSFKERFVIGSFLPKQSDIVTMIIAKDIIEKVETTQEENKLAGVKPNPQGGVSWDVEQAKAIDKEIDFTNPEIELLQTQIKLRDTKKEITQELLGLVIKLRDMKPDKKKKP